MCAGSVGAAALYLIEDEEVLAPFIYRLISAMECFLQGYGEDGACPEGITYWSYGFAFYVYFAELLKQRTGGKIDMLKSEKAKQISLFHQKCYLSYGKVLSFSDSFSDYSYHPGLIHHLKSIFDEIEIPEKKYSTNLFGDHCYRWSHFIRNLVWSSPVYESNTLSEASYYLKDVQWFISRKIIVVAMAGFAVNGGHNGVPHNHNDLGSFILSVNGDNLIADFGMGEYSKQYFGPERYNRRKKFCMG